MINIILFLLCFQTTFAVADDIRLRLNKRDLGMKQGKIISPEGISISPSGVIYVTSMKTGKVFSASKPDYNPVEVVDLSKLQGWKNGKRPKALGTLAESENQLWVALPNVWGGCIYSIKRSQKTTTAKAAFCHAGDVNGLVIDQAADRLYATSRYAGFGTKGMILSIPLNELKASVSKSEFISFDSKKHLLVEADMPNGLALSANKKSLLFVQTMKDRVSAVNIATKKVTTVFKTGESGWLDGLAYIEAHKLFVVTDSKLGKLHFFTARGERVQSIEVLNLEGNSTGLASLSVLGDRIYVTDMWKGDFYAKAIEEITGEDSFITYHSRVYNLSIKELLGFKTR